MKNRILIIYLFVLFSAGNLYALTVTVTFDDPAVPAAIATQAQTDIASTLAKYSYMPDLARGFGNANTYSSYAATLKGYQGYDIFAIAVGSMVSIQAPNGDPMFFTKMQKQLDTGDIYFGVGGNPIVGEAGLNLGFLVDGLYLSFKFGKFNYKYDKDSYKIKYDSNLFGALLGYQLINEKSILAGILLWRGISFDSGFIYSNNIVSLYKKLDPLAPITSGTFTAVVDPSIDFVLDTKTIVIPIEVYTSVRLLYMLNFGVGGGVDYVPYGRTSFSLKSAGPIVVTNSALPGYEAHGTASIDASTNGIAPNKYRPKLMMNFGLSLGPVFIDMPMTYYYTDNGYALGISAGMVW